MVYFMKVDVLAKKTLKKAKKGIMDFKDTVDAKKKQKVDALSDGKVVGKVEVRESAWLGLLSAKYEDELVRPLHGTYTTNMVTQTAFPVVSMARDKAIEELSQSGAYDFSDMLVIINPYAITPLTALALFDTQTSCKVRFTVKGKEKKKKDGSVVVGDDISGEIPATTRHRVPIFGLYPNTENNVLLELIGEDGECLDSRTFVLKTGLLPPGIRKMVKTVKRGKNGKAGLVFVYGGETPKPYAFDSRGDIRYYLSRRPRGYGLHPISGGRFIFADKNTLEPNYANPHTTQAYEMDLFGRTFAIYNIANGLHHDACEMVPGGNLLAAGSSLQGYNEDTVIEIDRKTGELVKEFNIASVLDETYKDSFDWAHINTVSYNEETNCVLICCRNLHTMLEIDWETYELKWMLCQPEFWEGTAMEEKLLRPVGEVQWHYQAHAAYEIHEDLDGNPDTRHFIIYDNHWHKRRPVEFFDNDENSYVRIYTVNEKEMTVSMLKNFPSAKAKIRSNGLLMTDRDRLMVMSGFLEPPVDEYMGMIYEYSYEKEKLIRQYMIKKSFYRAYELWADYAELVKPQPLDTAYMKGVLHPFTKCEKPEWETVLSLPHCADEECVVLDAEEETNRSYDIVKIHESTPYEALITFFMREDILYVRAKDHLIQKLYLVGKEHFYVHDNSHTKQKMEDVFGKLAFCVAMPLDIVECDEYDIYIETENGVFDTKKYIHKTSVE